MKASEIRAEARKSLAGKWKKAVLIILAFFVITSVMLFIQGLFKSGDKDTALSSIIGICVTVISIPLGYGMLAQFIKLKRGEDVKSFDFFKLGMDSFKRVWCINLHVFGKLLLPCILVGLSYVLIMYGTTWTYAGIIVAMFQSSDILRYSIIVFILGIILFIITNIWLTSKSLLYILQYFILFDRPDMTNKQIVEESARLMEGNRMKYFLLSLPFIGWAILATIPLGLGYLWLTPYMTVATIPLGLGYLWLTPYMTVATIIFYENLAGISNKNPIIEAHVDENTQPEEVIQTENNDNNDNPIQ